MKGELIVTNVDELHTNNNITKQSALTEKGAVVNACGWCSSRCRFATPKVEASWPIPGDGSPDLGNICRR